MFVQSVPASVCSCGDTGGVGEPWEYCPHGAAGEHCSVCVAPTLLCVAPTLLCVWRPHCCVCGSHIAHTTKRVWRITTKRVCVYHHHYCHTGPRILYPQATLCLVATLLQYTPTHGPKQALAATRWVYTVCLVSWL